MSVGLCTSYAAEFTLRSSTSSCVNVFPMTELDSFKRF